MNLGLEGDIIDIHTNLLRKLGGMLYVACAFSMILIILTHIPDWCILKSDSRIACYSEVNSDCLNQAFSLAVMHCAQSLITFKRMS